MKVKNWLMDIEQCAYACLTGWEAGAYDLAEAKAQFLRHYPNQERIFDACKEELDQR